MKIVHAVMLGFCLLFAGSPALAETYYLSESGVDEGDGLAGSPWKTFGYALGRMVSRDVLVVGAGTYPEQVVIALSGEEVARVVIRAAAGSRPIIDGSGVTLADEDGGLVEISGAYVTFEGFEVRNSPGEGISVSGDNATVRDCVVHGSELSAVHFTYASGGSVVGNVVHDNVMSNSDLGGEGAACVLIQGSAGVSVLGNTVHQNFGNGISIVEGQDIRVAGNTAYDNVPNNLICINTTDVTVLGNFSYCTGDPDYSEAGAPPVGISLEGVRTGGGAAPTIVVSNNIVTGCDAGIFWSRSGVGSGMRAMLIANNTLVETAGYAIVLDGATLHRDSTIANNIVMQSEGWLIEPGTASGIHYECNNWVGATPPVAVVGAGDVLVDCDLVDAPSSVADDFKIPTTSHCRNAGVSFPAVTHDYFGTSRPVASVYDVGAHEVLGTPPPVDAAVPDSQPADAAVPDVGPDVAADSEVSMDTGVDASAVDQGIGPVDSGEDSDDARIDAGLDQGATSPDGSSDQGGAGDAGVGQDAGLPPGEDDEAGCACHLRGGGGQGASWFWALCLVGLLWSRRRAL